MKYEEYLFGDIASFRYGKMPDKNRVSSVGKYPVFSGYRITGYYDEYNLDRGKIVIVARGVGGTGDVKLSPTRCYLTNLSIAAEINEQVADIHYIYYYFTNRNLRYLDSGSAQSQITISDLEKVKVKLPELIVQKRISNILLSIDYKIELNNRINENLEKQLHLLFAQIFNGISTDVILGDVVETTSGGTPSRKHSEYYENGTLCWVKSKELLCSYIHDTEEHINNLALSQSSAKMLPKHSVLIAMYGATVGAYGIISKPMACNQAICALLSNERYPYTYLFQIAHEQQQKLINMAVGSAQQNISQVLIKQLPLHSDASAIRKFHVLAQPLHKQIEQLQAENKTLSETRDILLPKLMNGEIDVSNIKI